MTPEELLIPRFYVLASYPETTFSVGEIILAKDGMITIEHDWSKTEINLDDYPQIFKKLEWWFDRKIEDLPKFVISTYNGSLRCGMFYEVERWFQDDEYLNHNSCQFFCNIVGIENRVNARNVFPATEEDYNDSKAKKLL